ncbi:hypothetical protein Tco_0490688 [Tanacetum coccineum]
MFLPPVLGGFPQESYLKLCTGKVERQNVVPSAEKTDLSQQGLEFLFSPLLEEYYNPTHGLAEENNNDQAPNASFQEAGIYQSCLYTVQEMVSIVVPRRTLRMAMLIGMDQAMQDELHQIDRHKSLGTSRQTIWQDDYKAKVVMDRTRRCRIRHVNSQNKARTCIKGYAQEKGDFEEFICTYGRTNDISLWSTERWRFFVAQTKGLWIQIHPENVTFSGKFVWINASSKSLSLLTKRLNESLKIPEGCINWSSWYPKDSGFELTAFSDADHAGCLDTSKRTSGGIQFLGYKLVSWMSKTKLHCYSSAEADYVAFLQVVHQVVRLGINSMIQPEPEDLPKDNPKLEIAVLRHPVILMYFTMKMEFLLEPASTSSGR